MIKNKVNTVLFIYVVRVCVCVCLGACDVFVVSVLLTVVFPTTLYSEIVILNRELSIVE